MRARARQRTVERLSWQDRANLLIEAADTPMHMAFLGLFDGNRDEAPDELLARLRLHVRSRLRRLPELHQVLGRRRLPPGPTTWVERDGIDLDRHVRAIALRAPGTEGQLLETAARLLARPLDRAIPLWEMWLITGVGGAGFAVLFKVHHAVTDGVGLLLIAETLLDGGPSPSPSKGASSQGGRGRAWAALAAGAHLVETPFAITSTLLSASRNAWTGGRIHLNRPIGPARALGVVRLRLADVRRVAHQHRVTVNDVLLDVAAGGIAEAAARRRRLPPSARIRVLLAVSPPNAGRGIRRNRSGAVVVSVPAGTARTPPDLGAVARASRRARRWQHPLIVERSLVAVAVTRLGRVLSRHQASVDTAVSNLIGPADPLYLLGRQMTDVIPVAPISGNVTIDVCAVSYTGRLNLGVLADAAAWPDLDVVVDGMRHAARVLIGEGER